jgi:lysozyme
VKQMGDTVVNTIIDIYHGNNINLERVKAAGIVAIIHKATEGATFQDSEYKERKRIAKEMGFLWGAYHFSTGADVRDQVENFLLQAEPDAEDLIALDFEPSNGPDMTIAQAREFVTLVRDETGRYPVIYGGHTLREGVGPDRDPILANCPLWYARYRSTPIGIPRQIWPTYTLWQYTDGNVGPEPHSIDGIGRCDRNQFQGTTEQLIDSWPFTRSRSA